MKAVNVGFFLVGTKRLEAARSSCSRTDSCFERGWGLQPPFLARPGEVHNRSYPILRLPALLLWKLFEMDKSGRVARIAGPGICFCGRVEGRV